MQCNFLKNETKKMKGRKSIFVKNDRTLIRAAFIVRLGVSRYKIKDDTCLDQIEMSQSILVLVGDVFGLEASPSRIKNLAHRLEQVEGITRTTLHVNSIKPLFTLRFDTEMKDNERTIEQGSESIVSETATEFGSSDTTLTAHSDMEES